MPHMLLQVPTQSSLFGRTVPDIPTFRSPNSLTCQYLEDLVENPGSNIDLYEKVMMENLIEVRELLRCRQSTAEHGYMATRPNGT